jgi:hypothetical protein
LDCVGEVERSAPDVAEAVPDSVAGNPVVAVVRNRPEVNLGVDWVEESEELGCDDDVSVDVVVRGAVGETK